MYHDQIEIIEGTADEIHIDMNLMPPHVQETLAAATLDFMRRLLAQPGSREALEKKKAELNLRKKQK